MDSMFECSYHGGSDIAYLCKTHDELCCFDCISQSHKECKYMLIRDLMEDCDPDKLCSRAVENVTDLKLNLERFIEFDKNEMDGLDFEVWETKRQVHDIVEKLTEKLKKLESQILRELDTKIQPIHQVYKERIESNKQSSEEVENIQYLLRKSLEDGTAFDKLIGVHRCSKDMLQIQKTLIKSSTDTKETHLKFKVNEVIVCFQNSLNSISSFGQIDTDQAKLDPGFKWPKYFEKIEIALNDDEWNNCSQTIPSKVSQSENLEAVLSKLDDQDQREIGTNDLTDKRDSKISSSLSVGLKEICIPEMQSRTTEETRNAKGPTILQSVQQTRQANESEKHCTSNHTDQEQKEKVCLAFLGKYNVRHSSDKRTCRIDSSTFLPDGRVIIVDFDNKSIKLLDGSFQLVASTEVESAPTDVTTVSTNTVAVTLPWKNKIQFVSVEDGLQLSNCINTNPCKCYGITCSNNLLYTTCRWCKAVHVYDVSGTLLRTLDKATDGKKLLTSYPYYIAVSAEANAVYVSCREEIVCVDSLSLRPQWRIFKPTAFDHFVALPNARLLFSSYGDTFVLESDGSRSNVAFIGEPGEYYKGINVDQTVIVGVEDWIGDYIIASKISYRCFVENVT